MIFYHGSKQKIDNPIVQGSNSQNDYGPSFYTTQDLELAKEWACKNNELGAVNKYQIRTSDFNSLKILDLTNSEEYSVLNWLAILMHHRALDLSFIHVHQQSLEWLKSFYININEYDVVKSFRADDSYFEFPLKFIEGQLSLEDLQEVFRLGNLGIQYAFMSKKAINKLKFVSCEVVEEKYVGRHRNRVIEATKAFRDITNRPIDYKKTLIGDLMKKYVGLL